MKPIKTIISDRPTDHDPILKQLSDILKKISDQHELAICLFVGKNTGDIQVVDGQIGLRKDAHMCVYRMDRDMAVMMGQQIGSNKEMVDLVRQGMDEKPGVSEEQEREACLHMVPTVH